MKTSLSFAALLLAATACTAPQQKPPVAASAATQTAAVDAAAEDRRLLEFLDRAFDETIASSPETLTALGSRKEYDKLNDYTDSQAQRQRALA